MTTVFGLVSIYSYLLSKYKYLWVDYRKFSCHVKTFKIEHQIERTENKNHYCLKLHIKS